MTDDIGALTARLAEEPGSLAFLELGEALRRRGQLEPALKIARGGVSRYPGLAGAHDLLARILCDRGELPSAFEAWADALRADPMHAPSLKGLAFLYFRAGDAEAAHHYLERALEADPDDSTIPAALARVAAEPAVAAVPSAPAPEPGGVAAGPAAEPSPHVADDRSPQVLAMDVLLVDGSGMRLRGTVLDTARRDVSDAVAAQLAGVSKEAARTARLLALGAWESVAIESPDGHLVLVSPAPEAVLLAAAGADVPLARLALQAERAARDARAWLERER